MSLAGCAHTKRSSIAFVKESGGSLSIWDADMSAAVGYETGQICMQRALAITTIDANATLQISEAILALSKAVDTAYQQQTDPKALADLTASLKQTATLLTTSTERTTFLDLGMFYLCQISANGGLTDTQTAELLKIIAISGASMNTDKIDLAIEAAKSVTISDGNNTATPRMPIENRSQVKTNKNKNRDQVITITTKLDSRSGQE